MRPLKILFVSRRFYPENLGGGHTSGFYIAKVIAALGHDVTVLTFSTKNEATLKKDGITIRRKLIKTIPGFRRLSNMDFMLHEMGRQLDAYLAKHEVDIVHSLNVESIPPVSRIAKKKYGKPMAITLNGPTLTSYPGTGVDHRGKLSINPPFHTIVRSVLSQAKGRPLSRKLFAFFEAVYGNYYLRMMRREARHADCICCVSEAINRMMLKSGFPEKQLTVVYNPIDVQPKKKTQIKEQTGLKGKDILLYVGRLDRIKGIPQMLRAMRRIENAFFLIVGRGEDETYLKDMACRFGVMDKVKFVGFVPNEKTMEYFSIADIAVLPCTWVDALPRTLLEAASLGIPIIASDWGGNPEIVEDGKNGFIVKAEDERMLVSRIKKVLSNQKLKAKMGKASQAIVQKKFKGSLIAEQYQQVYQTLMKK